MRSRASSAGLRTWTVVLDVVAILAGTVATFMPMKAILLLASGEIPGFFPSVLIDAGTEVTVAAMLGASVLMAVLASLCTKTAASRRVAEAISAGTGSSLEQADIRAVFRSRQGGADPAAEWVVLLIFGLVLAWISPPFLAGTCAWLAVAFLWVRISYKTEAKPHTSAARTSARARRFSRFVRQALLPSSIIISLLSLLVGNPRLGVTGALLVIIVGRRFQIATVRIVSSQPNRESADGEDGAGQAMHGHPADALASTIGLTKNLKAINDVLRQHGTSVDQCLIANPQNSPQQVTFVSGDQVTGTSVYWRIFGSNAWHLRSLEASFRMSDAPVSLFAQQRFRECDVGEFPMLEIEHERALYLDPQISGREVRTWYANLVAECLTSESFQEWARTRATPFDHENLERLLIEAQQTPGLHQGPLAQLHTVIPQLNQELGLRPFCWVKRGEIPTSAFLRGGSGELIITAPQGWFVGQVGDSAIHRTKQTMGSGADSVDTSDEDAFGRVAKLARYRGQLTRQLTVGDYFGAVSSTRKLLKVSDITPVVTTDKRPTGTDA